MNVHIYINYNNIVVLKYYLDIIKSAFEKEGYTCDYVKSLEGLSKDDMYVFPMALDAFKFYFKGFHNFVLWQQGATADESFMRHGSKVRYNVLNFIDSYAMRKAKMIFFCSQYMMEYYEKISKCKFYSKSYIMPCYNEQLKPNNIVMKDYNKKSFAYVGSLDLWQCFDETVEVFKKIQEKYPYAELKVLTFSVEQATDKLEKANIKNYIVKCVPKEDVQNELQNVVYGFILRKDSIVNRVATPTKLSSYMSAGIIPIFSTVLDDFNRVTSNMKYVIPISDFSKLDTLMDNLNGNINKSELLVEYSHLFNTYYATQHHIEKIQKQIRGLLNDI